MNEPAVKSEAEADPICPELIRNKTFWKTKKNKPTVFEGVINVLSSDRFLTVTLANLLSLESASSELVAAERAS